MHIQPKGGQKISHSRLTKELFSAYALIII